ncbi:MAG: site-specific DNA-methyltransferase, partial [Ginsengibacter sp.]
MQHLLHHLERVLEKDERLTVGGKLLKNKVIELALQPDEALLKLLAGDEKTRKHFFTTAGDILIFDKIQFQKFVNNKSFLPDSFTSFENRLGLTNDKEFVSGTRNVVLSWPYKDCVLEGGQSKEDLKRDEIFWNETLAPGEIDRLLHPKIFTGFKKYTSDGNEIPKEILANDNWIIRGNNLLVLHSLLPVFAQKIKLIYIDPPYNTGSDGFLYNDNFNHSTWLTFMKNRLEVAWKLLSIDGAIFIQTDDTEHAYLKVLCDELFGRENFKESIVLKSSTESGVNAINVKRGERLFKVKETILFYCKSSSFRFKPFYTKATFNTNYKYEVVKERKGYTVTDLNKKFFENGLEGRKKKDLSPYEVMSVEQQFIDYALAHPKNIFSLEKNIKKAGEKFKKFAEANKPKGIVEEFINSSGDKVLMYDGGVLVPLHERVISENGKNYFGVLASDLWVDIGTTPFGEGGVAFSNGKKPEKLLKRIIEMATDENDIVLDYHLGSGTTAAVAHKLKRRYIGIEQMDYGENDSVARLQNVINGDASGISKSIGWKGGGSFIYCTIKKLNEDFMEKILALKNGRDANK